MTKDPEKEMPVLPRVLSIAGSDSGGGAGIQADTKTCTALGCYGMTAITAITAQNTVGVTAIHEIPVDTVAAQIAAVYDDIGVDAVKTGMLSSAAIIETVADALKKFGAANLVVDPVMISKSGAALLRSDAVEAMKQNLLPLAAMLCPNIPEAEVLSGMTVSDEKSIAQVLERLYGLGPKHILLKGGHLKGPAAADYLFDGASTVVFSSERIDTPHTHGTGCTYSAAIACFLAKGFSPTEAVRHAKNYLTGAIMHNQQVRIGRGTGPLHHGWNLEMISNNG